MEGKTNIASASHATRCPQCGNEVACGAQGVQPGDTGTANVTCWCLDWPHLPASARLGVGACLCPACLRAALLAAGVALEGTPADLP
ncbi:cysteine-rich CWC family protein [Pandoraea pneumonica]|uniref:cysteine-rich CWC family protein n=1 Tax=Pandoraea pneumonica TaxID=2508299 RepID=UPI003CF2DBDC